MYHNANGSNYGHLWQRSLWRLNNFNTNIFYIFFLT